MIRSMPTTSAMPTAIAFSAGPGEHEPEHDAEGDRHQHEEPTDAPSFHAVGRPLQRLWQDPPP
jgi:hypothetical protein